jgi:hypothetical protein
MAILALSALLTLRGIKRGLIFFCPAVLLCVAAGLLGRFFLEENRAIASPVRVAVIDEDGSFESGLLINYLLNMEGYEQLISFSEAGPQDGLGEFDAAVTLPQGFFASVMQGGNRPFTVTLKGGSELKAGLLRIFADMYADMLRTAQIGVYSSLDEASAAGEDAWGRMRRDANLRFLGAVLGGRALFEENELSATGGAGALLSYGVSALVFIIMTSGVLFLDLWRGAAARPVLLGLRAAGAPPLRSGVCYLLGAGLPFLATGILPCAAMAILLRGELFAGASFLAAIMAVILLFFCGGGLMLTTAVFTHEGGAGCLFVFACNIIWLFLSGGIIPWGWLSPGLKLLGGLTPNLYFTRLITGSLLGNINPTDILYCFLWAAILGLAAIAGLWRRGKAWGRP